MIITKEIFPLVKGNQEYLKKYQEMNFMFHTTNIPNPLEKILQTNIKDKDNQIEKILIEKSKDKNSTLNSLKIINDNYKKALKDYLIGFYIKLQNNEYNIEELKELFWQTNPYFVKGYLRNIKASKLNYSGKGYDNPAIRRIRRLKTETKAYNLAMEISKERNYSIKEIINETWKQKENWKGLAKAYLLLNENK